MMDPRKSIGIGLVLVSFGVSTFMTVCTDLPPIAPILVIISPFFIWMFIIECCMSSEHDNENPLPLYEFIESCETDETKREYIDQLDISDEEKDGLFEKILCVRVWEIPIECNINTKQMAESKLLCEMSEGAKYTVKDALSGADGIEPHFKSMCSALDGVRKYTFDGTRLTMVQTVFPEKLVCKTVMFADEACANQVYESFERRCCDIHCYDETTEKDKRE